MPNKHFPLAGERYTRLAVVRTLPQVLAALGADAEAILRRHGFAAQDFEDRDRTVRYTALARLLKDCERAARCDHLGLLICEHAGLDGMGLPGRVARCQPTVREALLALMHHHNLRRAPGLLTLLDDGTLAGFVYAIAAPVTFDTHDYQAGGLAIACNILRELCGPEWHPVEVRCAFRSPASPRAFQRVFRAPVHFDADSSVIVFQSHWLDRLLPPVEDSYHDAVATEVRISREAAFVDFPGLVSDLIHRQLSGGGCSIDSVAAALAMHRRTLARRLERHGETYGALQAAVKCEVAQRLLRETDLSVQQVGEFLGFSSPANFATAFRRWAGRSPRRFRREER